MLQHWSNSGFLHNFAVDLATSTVWDYRRDMYVHRIKELGSGSGKAGSRGKTESSPTKCASGKKYCDAAASGPGADDFRSHEIDSLVSDAKQESIATEYVHL